MKKSILATVLLAFALTSAGPAGAVRGKEKSAKASTQSKAAASSGVQSKSGAQSKASASQASKAAAASSKSSTAR